MTKPPSPAALAAVAAGGALGALARWSVGEVAPHVDGFPWHTFAINVVGSLLLALLPALLAVRQRPLLAVALGPGVLGGFTTLSAYAEESRALVADGRPLVAGAYVLGTMAACLIAVHLATRLTTPVERSTFEAEEGNE